MCWMLFILDGLGWEKPRYMEMPVFEDGFDFMDTFKVVSKRNSHYVEFWASQEDSKLGAFDCVVVENGSVDAEPTLKTHEETA